MEQSYEKQIQSIKMFYSFLGNYIHHQEDNDPDEVEFISDYIHKFFTDYNQYILESYSPDISDQYEDESDDDSDADSDDDSDVSTETGSDNENSNKSFDELYQKYLTEPNKKNPEAPNYITNFIENSINIDNIILYNKSKHPIKRCETYLNYLNTY